MTVSVSASKGTLREMWEYYWFYTRTRTGIHAAATAALTAFGLLAYFHQGFVFLAFAAYLLPPLYLYVTTDDAARDRTRTKNVNTDTDTDADADADGMDVDIDGRDADADGIDADADGRDADADGIDVDVDG